MQFSEKDRKLMLDIAKRLGTLEKRLDSIASVEKGTLTPFPIQSMKSKSEVRVRKTLNRSSPIARISPTSTINVIFKDKRGDDPKSKLMVEALYKALKELCDENGVFSLDVHISNE